MNPEAIREFVAEKDAQIEELEEENEQLRVEVESLKNELWDLMHD